MAKLTNAEEYVKAVRNAQALWSNLSAEERTQAAEGIRWLEAMGEVYTGPKLRGRPPGAKNRTAQLTPEPPANMELGEIPGE